VFKNASSLQFLSSIKRFIASWLQFFLSIKCFIAVTFCGETSFSASSPLLFKVTLPTSADKALTSRNVHTTTIMSPKNEYAGRDSFASFLGRFFASRGVTDTVFTEVTFWHSAEYGILHGSEFNSAEVRIIPRNTVLSNSAEFRVLFFIRNFVP
jgi:hypothetical protein